MTRIEFPDCETVTFVGDFAETMVGLVTLEPDGMLGTHDEVAGPVDGERTVRGEELLEDVPLGPIVTDAEGFLEDTAVVPGNGDVSARHPAYEDCEASLRAAYEAGRWD